jgi:hypothetical protein
MRVIFQHMPKTGGRAIQAWLDQMYPGSMSIEIEANRHWRYHLSERAVELTPEAQALVTRDDIFVHGHAPYAALFPIRRPTDVMVTLLREPLSRISSWYRYLRSPQAAMTTDEQVQFQVKLAKGTSFERFVELEHPFLGELSNSQAGFLMLGQDYRDATDSEVLLECKRRLGNYDVVGDYKRITDFARSMAYAIGVLPPKVLPPVNTSAERGVDVTQRARETIYERNSVDAALYGYVSRRFDAHYAGIINQLLEDSAMGRARAGLDRCGWEATRDGQLWTVMMPSQGSNWLETEASSEGGIPFRFTAQGPAEIVLDEPDLGGFDSNKLNVEVMAVHQVVPEVIGNTRFVLNGHEGTKTITTKGPFTVVRFTIPIEAVAGRGSVRLVVHSPIALAPAEFDLINADRRVIGMAIHGVLISSAEE